MKLIEKAERRIKKSLAMPPRQMRQQSAQQQRADKCICNQKDAISFNVNEYVHLTAQVVSSSFLLTVLGPSLTIQLVCAPPISLERCVSDKCRNNFIQLKAHWINCHVNCNQKSNDACTVARVKRYQSTKKLKRFETFCDCFRLQFGFSSV